MYLNKFLVKLAKDLDTLGLHKYSDDVNEHLTRLAQNMPFRIDTLKTPYQTKTNINPLMSSALGSEAYTGTTLGYEVAGNVPGGLLSDIQGTNVPIALQGITPEKYSQIMKDPTLRENFLNWFNQTLNAQTAQFGAGGADAVAFDKNVRKHFEADIDEAGRVQMVTASLPMLKDLVSKNIAVNPRDKQNIKKIWIEKFQRPPYTNHPNVLSLIINTINQL
jgi:hypothetical protein